MTEIAPCRKCETEINTEAERCPQCGFEPGFALAPLIAVILGLPAIIIGLIFLSTGFYALYSGDIVSTIWGCLLGTVVGGFGVLMFYALFKGEEATPTHEPDMIWN